jgi:putative endonuclease
MWFVYVLLCRDGSFYTGVTNNLDKRLLDHQTGKGAKYTRSHYPIKIIYQEFFSTHSEALKREAEIKSWSKERKVRELNLNMKK